MANANGRKSDSELLLEFCDDFKIINKGRLVGVVFTSCVAKEKLTDGD